MCIPRLLIIIGLSTQLYGMKNEHEWALYKEIRKSPHTQLIPFSCSPNAIGNSINFAEKSGDGNTMAKLLYLCLPKEVIAKHIAPHLIEYITTKYKHNLIAHTYPWTPVKEMIQYDNDSALCRHDGTYATAPSINCEYAIWKASANHYFCEPPIMHWRMSADNKLTLDTPITDPNEQNTFEIKKENNDNTSVNFALPMSHCLFSSDNTLVAFGSLEIAEENLVIFDSIASKLSNFSLNGKTTNLCSAHHSPTFAVGSYDESSSLGELVLIQKCNDNLIKKYLDTYAIEITCIEFSPDDSRLLVSLYYQESDYSALQLWNTSNCDTIRLITTIKNCGSIAFFICNGEKIITTQSDGTFSLLNGLTGNIIKEPGIACIAPNLTISSNKNKLIIAPIDGAIQFFSSETGDLLQELKNWNEITEIGLSADEKSIIILQEDEKDACQLQLYDEQQQDHFDFIATKANIVQLYEILDLYEKNNDTPYFIEKVKEYI